MKRINWKTWTGTATFWKTLSKRSLIVFLAGVFCLFGSLGFILDSGNPLATTAGELTMNIWVRACFAVGWAFFGTHRMSRIPDYAQGEDPLNMQRHTPTVLAALIVNASDRQLTTRPSPKKRSIGEILAHLAEDEIATAWRYRQMVEHSGIALSGFDHLWARVGDYASRAAQDSLNLFRLPRCVDLQFLQQLAPEQWECFGIHAERGRITVRSLVAHMAGRIALFCELRKRPWWTRFTGNTPFPICSSHIC